MLINIARLTILLSCFLKTSHDMMIGHFLVSPNLPLRENHSSHTGCICVIFLHCVLKYVLLCPSFEIHHLGMVQRRLKSEVWLRDIWTNEYRSQKIARYSLASMYPVTFCLAQNCFTFFPARPTREGFGIRGGGFARARDGAVSTAPLTASGYICFPFRHPPNSLTLSPPSSEPRHFG